jgi:hypothetical protein
MSENDYPYKAISEIIDATVKAKEKCMKEILRVWLEREPTLEDAEKCTLVGEQPVNYERPVEYIYYDGLLLGSITIDRTDMYNHKIVFNPIK